MYTDMDNWAEIRRRVLADGLSGRAACREYKIHWKTLKKILDNTEPPGYRRTKPKRPERLVGMRVAARAALGYMTPGREDVIGGGALILERILDRTPVTTLRVSVSDILDGIAWSCLTDRTR